MTVLIQELCNGDDGVALTAANSEFVFNAAETPGSTFFDTSLSVEGACSVITRPWYESPYLTVTAKQFYYVSFYVRVNDATPTNVLRLAFTKQTITGARTASVDLSTAGKIVLMHGNSTVVGTSALSVTDNSWLRLDWYLPWGSGSPLQKVDIYVGDNVHGTTPDESLSGTWDSTTPVGFVGFANNGSTSQRTWYDRIIIRDDRFPEPLSSNSVIVEEVLSEALGHTIDVGQMTWLKASVGEADLTMSFDTTGTRVSRGIVEVGDELVFVSSISQDTGQAVIAPFGRGFRGTVAQSWPINTLVTMAPRFPRKRVLDAINSLLETTYPFIYAVSTTKITVGGAGQIAYELPKAATGVLRVEVSTVGPSDDWELVERWAFNNNADTTAFPSGKSLDIIEYLTPGRTIQVTYAHRPTKLSLSDEFETCGLRASAWPAIMYGAVHRLTTGAVAGESGSESVQAADKNRTHRSDPAGVQREYYTLHRQYLIEERNRLLEDYPATNNWEL